MVGCLSVNLAVTVPLVIMEGLAVFRNSTTTTVNYVLNVTSSKLLRAVIKWHFAIKTGTVTFIRSFRPQDLVSCGSLAVRKQYRIAQCLSGPYAVTVAKTTYAIINVLLKNLITKSLQQQPPQNRQQQQQKQQQRPLQQLPHPPPQLKLLDPQLCYPWSYILPIITMAATCTSSVRWKVILHIVNWDGI